MEQTMELVSPQATETALYLLTKAEIDTQIATAKAFPRSVSKCLEKAMSMVMLSEDIAASCSYSLPRGGGKIEGKSIRLAEIVASNFQNISYGSRVVSNDGKIITAQGVCFDLENNVRSTLEVSRKITDSKGKTFSQDMQTVTGNAASAIARRNAIFSVIPSALTDSIYDKAKEVARGTVATLVTRRTKAVEYFKSIGVTEKQLCEVLEIQKIGDIDLDRLETLTGFKAAIKNGETTVKDIFEKPEPETINPATLEELFHALADAKKLTPDETTDIAAILQNKETNSYPKVLKILNSK
jgi:hypothetical protein